MDNNLRPTRRPDIPSRGGNRGGNSVRDRMRGANNEFPVAPTSPDQQAVPNAVPIQPAVTPPSNPEQEASNQQQNTKKRASLPSFNSKKIAIVAGAIVAGVLILGGLAFGITKLTAPPTIPSEIKKQISFVILYPNGREVLKVDKKTIEYDKPKQVLLFSATTSDGNKLVFSEQETPATFKDILPAYHALLTRLGTYTSIKTKYGEVSLIKPKQLNGGQSATINSKGTTITVRPSKNMTDDAWKKVFNNLIIIK